ncbi:CubicO group peptidase, beta-lactamase class C family [Paenibacillus catalpae]|uniref:CubicO group peptidase, beta-lactamase class C family n=1 Tax=Paenibacillus catalpae TaxID=1045775 RepID=A0A1I1UK68_9BACL|nr:serine hydrolase [Paenibacillus catalpae]SFD71216.1 CubicO group peptidase, beta-lactamase class C family [Paenibacillus catalpae]
MTTTQKADDPYLRFVSPSVANLDETKLEQMKEWLEEWKMTSVMILRDDALAWEWHAKGEDSVAPLLSCTKSVLSSLIGIAIEEGYIQSVEQPVGDFFEGTPDSSIQIKHLLTMTSGWDWPDFDKPYKAMKKAADPIGFVLERPVISEPGTAYLYNSGGSHLLSAILTAATGQSALDYATSRLFQPMAFRQAKWTSHKGINEGGTGLQLYGRDLAKLGLLYLREGDWFGEQLIPPRWVLESTKKHHRGLLHYEPPIYGAYGYHWWQSPAEHNGAFDCYFAFGHGGQYLLVAPEERLVVVVRKALAGRNEAVKSRNLIFEHIAGATKK